MSEFSLGRALPNSGLEQRSAAVGSSGVNVQDANLLKVYAVYGAPMIVPLVGPLISEALSASGDFEPFERQLLARNRLPIIASATVHMQSRLIGNDFVVSRAELAGGPLCTGNLLRLVSRYQHTGRQRPPVPGGHRSDPGGHRRRLCRLPRRHHRSRGQQSVRYLCAQSGSGGVVFQR